jgi:ATP-dependent DNA helicase RecG
LREAIINSLVHNDYTREASPKFEIFEDRIEITSAGSLPEGLSENEFFEGSSMPRNKELMRVFKDLELVEQLGSGVPRILQHYDKKCFKFSDNFLRMSFPKAATGNQVSNQVSNQVGNQVSNQVLPSGSKLLEALENLLFGMEYRPSERNLKKYQAEASMLTETESSVLEFCQQPRKRKEILEDCLGLSNQTKNFKTNIEPLIEGGLIAQTIKDRPQSQFQRYLITNKG